MNKIFFNLKKVRSYLLYLLAELFIENDLEEILNKYNHLELVDKFYELNIFTIQDLSTNSQYFSIVLFSDKL